ncbi:MAG: DoxX family protein [Micrococcales bacterium]
MNGIVSVVIALAGIGFGVWAALTFWKAGNFKLKGNKEAFAAAGFGWAAKTPIGVIRVIGFLEVLGAIGVVLAPAAALIPGFEWSQYVGVAAALGLVLTMVAAMIVHQSRGESKYTFKMNFKLLAIALVAAVLDALVVLPLTF